MNKKLMLPGKNMQSAPPEWWAPKAGFFGRLYMDGDNSCRGYLPGKAETLEARTEREASGVISLLSLQPPARILDIPTGYGRHTINLAIKGYRVTGIDINDEHLAAAKSQAENAGVFPEFMNRDMRNIGAALYGKFNAVINMFYSFGFFTEERENTQTMKEFHTALRPEGQLLIHTDVSPEMILVGGEYKLCEVRELNSGGKLLIDESYDIQTKRINGTWAILDSSGKEEKLTPYSVRIYSANEFEELALSCGFREVKLYGSFEGEKFTPESKELIIVATK